MKLSKLEIEGYRRLKKVECILGDATFLIGPNNFGKSSVLDAITHLLSANKRIPEEEYYSETDEETGERKTISSTIVLTGTFTDLPEEAKNWRGFKGRVFEYHPENPQESGLLITYRKTYELGKDITIEIRSKNRVLKHEAEGISIPRDIMTFGVSEDDLLMVFDDLDRKITPAQKVKLHDFNELWDIVDGENWFHNPGGIPGVILSKLPRYIIIPADIGTNELSGNGVLHKTLNELFEDVRSGSENYRQAQRFLDELAKELNPEDKDSQFGKMMLELNKVISSVFPESKIHAHADLSDPDKSLRPTFNIELSSNIKTSADHQGAGMVRSAVFGILRFRQKWLSRREDLTGIRSIMIGFEEPEIFLHPSAANQMRDTIYDLSSGESQIIATTHSPFLIDISRKPKQILNRFSFYNGCINIEPFNVSENFNKLQDKDKSYVKMILKVDDYISRVFFTQRIIIVEGDTEEIVIRETLKRLDKARRLAILSKTEIIKARGKAAIIGLAKYLISFGITPFIIHDRDGKVDAAKKFNNPIKEIVGDENVIQLEECIEDVLGYPIPIYEKPYTAYEYVKKWGDTWDDIPEPWKTIVSKAFNIGSI